ncbi:MAG: cysteine--tRNA ligase [Pseudomonadota bacterium]
MTDLMLHDTMAGEKRVFTPADPSRVTMYVCGPTVYNHAHIGNFRAAIVFDLLFRLLRHHYGTEHVIYARNFTDIDDKIIKASRETGDPIDVITTKYAKIYQDETAAFNNLTPTLEPRATDHIVDMQALITKLIDESAAYVAEDHVLFSIESYDEYGQLSHVDKDEMVAGARVEVAPYKKDAADFVLWKPSSDDEPGWTAPDAWGLEGRGRPGWHLECSAMINKNLGTTIDIHGGGQDLRFPHHENECAQSACANNGAPLARYWLHNGFLRMGADKMSKSLGNVVLPKVLLQKWPGEALRFALLSAQYRQPLEWTEGLIEQSKRQLDRFYRLFSEAPDALADTPPESIVLSLNDDLNTPAAIAGLHELRDIANQMEGLAKATAIGRLRAAGQLMGLFQADPEAWFKEGTTDGPDAAQIEALIEERAAAKKAKDYARADEIRDQLTELGVLIEDGPDGTTWRRA